MVNGVAEVTHNAFPVGITESRMLGTGRIGLVEKMGPKFFEVVRVAKVEAKLDPADDRLDVARIIVEIGKDPGMVKRMSGPQHDPTPTLGMVENRVKGKAIFVKEGTEMVEVVVAQIQNIFINESPIAGHSDGHQVDLEIGTVCGIVKA